MNNKQENNTIGVDPVELKTIELRLNAVKDATHRSRFVFVIMTIMTATVLISLWNARLSWETGVAFDNRTNTTISTNQATVISEWIRNSFVSVGLLGIRVSTNDLAVIGSASIVIIMIWFFFNQRRENRAIVGLLRDCYLKFERQELSHDACNLVYEGIVQNILFIDMGGGDRPIEGLVSTPGSGKSNRFVRIILAILVFLPPITILMIIVSDLWSLRGPSPLRASQTALWRIIWDNKDYWSIGKILGFEAFAIAAYAYTIYICLKCRDFSQATASTIQSFFRVAKGEEEALGQGSPET